MGYRTQFNRIKNLLKEHQGLWDREIIHPNFTERDDWNHYARELSLLSFDRLEQVANLTNLAGLDSRLYQLLFDIERITKVKQFPLHSKPLPKALKRGVNEKKLHELTQLHELFKQLNPKHVIDVGGGKGHTSRVLLHAGVEKCLVLDQDADLIEKGETLGERWFPQFKERIDFRKTRVSSQSEISCKGGSYLLGLHSCGELSLDVLKHGQGMQGLFNVACCYHKASLFNQSEYSQAQALQLPIEALTLAAKKSYMSAADLRFKKRVKFYRYALEIFSQERLGRSIKSVGNGKAKDYDQEFFNYAHQFLPACQSFSKNDLKSFYQSKQLQQKLNHFFYLDVLREVFARSIELYIILDRVIWLQEGGTDVEFGEIFDYRLSPRNLAIFTSF